MKESLKLIINADDFGYKDSVNAGVLWAFSEKLCSSTTIMANMDGFEQACELVHENKLETKTGLHIVLTEGKPLTDPIRSCSRICDSEGQFRMENRSKLFYLNSDEKYMLYQEISAQIQRARQKGLVLTHLDSHQHVHLEWAAGKIMMQVAKEYNIPYIRLGRSSDPESRWYKNLYRSGFNLRLRMNGLAGPDFFGTPEDFQCFFLNSPKLRLRSAEIMIHPGLDENGHLIDVVTHEDLRQSVKGISCFENAISYCDLAENGN